MNLKYSWIHFTQALPAKEITIMKNKFLNLNCMDEAQGLPSYPDNFFHLAIVDPPYGLPKDSSNGRGKLQNRSFNKGNISRWDKAPDKRYFKELFRVSKNQIIWGGNYFNLKPCRGFICWDKKQPWTNFSQAEFAWTSFDCPSKVYRFDNRTGGKIHPTQKPIQLYQKIIADFANPGDLILDTHVGSASSLIAFESMGFNYHGFEIDKDYYKAATKRMAYGIQSAIF